MIGEHNGYRPFWVSVPLSVFHFRLKLTFLTHLSHSRFSPSTRTVDVTVSSCYFKIISLGLFFSFFSGLNWLTVSFLSFVRWRIYYILSYRILSYRIRTALLSGPAPITRLAFQVLHICMHCELPQSLCQCRFINSLAYDRCCITAASA